MHAPPLPQMSCNHQMEYSSPFFIFCDPHQHVIFSRSRHVRAAKGAAFFLFLFLFAIYCREEERASEECERRQRKEKKKKKGQVNADRIETRSSRCVCSCWGPLDQRDQLMLTDSVCWSAKQLQLLIRRPDEEELSLVGQRRCCTSRTQRQVITSQFASCITVQRKKKDASDTSQTRRWSIISNPL